MHDEDWGGITRHCVIGCLYLCQHTWYLGFMLEQRQCLCEDDQHMPCNVKAAGLHCVVPGTSLHSLHESLRVSQIAECQHTMRTADCVCALHQIELPCLPWLELTLIACTYHSLLYHSLLWMHSVVMSRAREWICRGFAAEQSMPFGCASSHAINGHCGPLHKPDDAATLHVVRRRAMRVLRPPRRIFVGLKANVPADNSKGNGDGYLPRRGMMLACNGRGHAGSEGHSGQSVRPSTYTQSVQGCGHKHQQQIKAITTSFIQQSATMTSSVSLSMAAVQQQMGLASELTNRKCTLLVPSDEAVQRYTAANPSQASLIMSGQGNLPIISHVVPDQTLTASEIPEGSSTLETMAGVPLTINNQGGLITVSCGGVTANVIKSDIPAGSSGIIHVVDNVLTPTA